MAADPSVFGQYLQQPRSALDYAADLDKRDMNALQLIAQRRQNDLSGLQAEQTRAQLGEATAKRNALAQLYGNPAMRGDPMALENALLADPRLTGEGQAMRKSRLDAGHLQAQTGQANAAAGKSGADQAKAEFDLSQARRMQHLQELVGVNDPQSAMRWLDDAQASGELKPENVAIVKSKLASDPGFFNTWKPQAIAAGFTLQQQAEQQWKARDFGLKGANSVMRPDPSMPGGYSVNTPFVQAEQVMRRAGAANTTTTINTGQKGLDNELKVRGDFRAEPVYKAHQEMQSAYSQIQQSLKQASPAGDLAAATKMMKLLDPGSVVRESELGMAMAATGLLDRVQSFVPNILNGTKLTPDQRKQFQALADALYGESVNQYNAKRGEYSGLAGDYGLNADRLLGGKAAAPVGRQQAGGTGSIDLGGGFSLKK